MDEKEAMELNEAANGVLEAARRWHYNRALDPASLHALRVAARRWVEASVVCLGQSAEERST